MNKRWFHDGRKWDFSAEVAIPTKALGVGVEFGNEEYPIQFYWHLGFFSFYLGMFHPFMERVLPKVPVAHSDGTISQMLQPQEWCVRVFWDRLWLKWGASPTTASLSDPSHRSLTLYPWDLLFGKRWFTEDTVDTQPILIPLPEDIYPAIIETSVRRWGRARLPKRWAKRKTCYHVKIERGLPIPGDPDSDYCDGDDAYYEIDLIARDMDHAIEECVKMVTGRRKRLGMPEKAKHAPVTWIEAEEGDTVRVNYELRFPPEQPLQEIAEEIEGVLIRCGLTETEVFKRQTYSEFSGPMQPGVVSVMLDMDILSTTPTGYYYAAWELNGVRRKFIGLVHVRAPQQKGKRRGRQ